VLPLRPVLTFCPSKWSAFIKPDPTHGLVEYVSHDTAVSEGMAHVLPNGAAVLSVDNKTDLTLNTPRKSCVLFAKFCGDPAQLSPSSFNSSMRITTTQMFNGGLFIADFARMPYGCSLWPAYWSYGTAKWPADGEIDILEGVNNQLTLVIPTHSPFFPFVVPWSYSKF
jgi:beta-glucanase (GH16 family)